MALGRSGTTLHVLNDAGVSRCGSESTPAGPITRDDLLCGRCLGQAPAGEIAFGDDVGLVLERHYFARLQAMPYADYLRSEHWRRTRLLALDRYGSSCVLCGAFGGEVHHRTYDRRGCERMEDLIVLCRSCHGRFHTEAA